MSLSVRLEATVGLSIFIENQRGELRPRPAKVFTGRPHIARRPFLFPARFSLFRAGPRRSITPTHFITNTGHAVGTVANGG